MVLAYTVVLYFMKYMNVIENEMQKSTMMPWSMLQRALGNHLRWGWPLNAGTQCLNWIYIFSADTSAVFAISSSSAWPTTFVKFTSLCWLVVYRRTVVIRHVARKKALGSSPILSAFTMSLAPRVCCFLLFSDPRVRKTRNEVKGKERSLLWSRYKFNFPAQICANTNPHALCCLKQDWSKLYSLREIFFKLFS